MSNTLKSQCISLLPQVFTGTSLSHEAVLSLEQGFQSLSFIQAIISVSHPLIEVTVTR